MNRVNYVFSIKKIYLDRCVYSLVLYTYFYETNQYISMWEQIKPNIYNRTYNKPTGGYKKGCQKRII